MERQAGMQVNTIKASGFTLIEVMVVAAIIGILAAIALPNFIRARAHSQINTCIANLTRLEGAKQNWALDNKKSTMDTPDMTDLVPNYLKYEPICPTGTAAYHLNDLGTVPTCPNYDASDADLVRHLFGSTP